MTISSDVVTMSSDVATMSSDVGIIYPVFYKFVVYHRNGTTGIKNVIGKANMTKKELKEFIIRARRDHANERKKFITEQGKNKGSTLTNVSEVR